MPARTREPEVPALRAVRMTPILRRAVAIIPITRIISLPILLSPATPLRLPMMAPAILVIPAIRTIPSRLAVTISPRMTLVARMATTVTAA